MPIKRTVIFIVFTWVLFALPQTYAAEDNVSPEAASPFTQNKAVTSQSYMAVTANHYATDAAASILNNGGSAIDAAIAAQMVLNVVEPQSSGIGGGGFLLYYDAASKKIISYDGRETAPLASDESLFIKNNEPMPFRTAIPGGLSVGTPGLLHMLHKVHQTHGKQPWASLFSPAITIAQNGFPLSPRLHAVLKPTTSLRRFASPAKLFLTSDGSPKPIGTIIKNPALANSFALLAEQGIKSFYQGVLGKSIVANVQRSAINPGLLSMNDLTQYTSKIRSNLCRPYRSYKICTMGPPSSGGTTILQILGMLENKALSELEILSAEAIHYISEAIKIAYIDRNHYLADPDFVTVPIEAMLDKAYLVERFNIINKYRAIVHDIAPGDFQTPAPTPTSSDTEPPSTTHLSVIDKEGNAVALTSSIEHAFGSNLMVRGFLLNNQLTDFSFNPEKNGSKVANRPQAGKRPRSSMSPTLVFDSNDKLMLVIGSPGGARIIPYMVQTLIAVIDWQMDIQAAIDMPHFLNLSSTLELEPGINESVIAELEMMGHHIRIRPLTSGLHAIHIKDGILYGAADPRREGTAKGR